MRHFFLLGPFLFLLMSCQTNMLKQFENLTPGMEKAQVLEEMGNPTTTTRMHNRDRWIYVFYEDKIRFEKEVHFLDGTAIYIGNKWEPSAEKQAALIDQQNSQKEVELAQQEKSEKIEKNQAFEDYEKKMKLQDGVRYLPVFTPVQ